jgi:heptaprenylglyceryl phosphate synthase
MLKELFTGRNVYFEPGRTMNGFKATVDFVKSIVPRTDNVLLVVVGGGVKDWELVELATH